MKRIRVLAFLCAVAVITFLDRLCISVAGPRMQDDLRLTSVQWGWILGAFVLSYGLFEIPTGAMGDRLGHRRVLTRIVLWWSVFTSLTGTCKEFRQLVLTRFLFGAGEAGAYPNISGVISTWFAASERARAQAFVWAASRLGGAISPIVVVPLMRAIGWRAMFGVLGVVGLCWVIAWELWYRDVATTRVDSCRQIPWRLILSDSQVLLIFAMYCCYAWGSWFFMAWFPTYLIRGAGFSESQMDIFSSLPFLMGICGNIAGGVISDRLVITRGVKVGRLAVACTSLIAASLLILCLALTQNKAAIVICSSVGFGVMDLMLPVSWAVCMDIGREYSGVVTGVMNSAGQLGGFICTVTVGYILRATGSYSIPLWIISGMVIISALLFTRIDPTRPINYDEPR